MLRLVTLLSILAASFAIEALINPSSTETLDSALQSKIDEIARNVGELAVLLNQDASESLLYRPNSHLAETSSALDTLLYDLDNLEEKESDSDDVKVEIIEITEVDPDEEDEDFDEDADSEDELVEIVESEVENEIEGRANSTIHDSRNRATNKNKSHGKAKTKLSAGKGSKKSKTKLSASKSGKSKKHKLSGSKTRKIVKKTTLSGNKRASSKGKIKLSAKQTKQAMKNLNSKEVKNICDTFSNKYLKTKSSGASLRGLGEEPAKPTIAMTLQQLTEAFNKLQSAIVTVNKGSPSSSSSTSSSTDLGPSAGNGDLSTISPQVASNIASVLHRMAAVTASTTSNPLDPIVKAAISVQGQAANALRGILPSGQRV